MTLAQFIILVITVFFAVFLGIGCAFAVMLIGEDIKDFRAFQKNEKNR